MIKIEHKLTVTPRQLKYIVDGLETLSNEMYITEVAGNRHVERLIDEFREILAPSGNA